MTNTVLTLGASLDLTMAAALKADLMLMPEGARLVDAGAVRRITTPCLQVLLAAERAWAEDGLSLELSPRSAALAGGACAGSGAAWRDAQGPEPARQAPRLAGPGRAHRGGVGTRGGPWRNAKAGKVAWRELLACEAMGGHQRQAGRQTNRQNESFNTACAQRQTASTLHAHTHT